MLKIGLKLSEIFKKARIACILTNLIAVLNLLFHSGLKHLIKEIYMRDFLPILNTAIYSYSRKLLLPKVTLNSLLLLLIFYIIFNNIF
ncbi:hypothetical protein ABW55_14280 [Acinetobacter sp. C15]|nr:hypothetical protein ABW55_14280 [Acinetobacter sp. C15]